MNITKKQMDEINQVQLSIFKEFVKVCDKLNLRYYLVHGSLLGAVRYRGFFPFDDDIDVAMPRKDYDTFVEKGQEILKKDLFIQCHRTESNYPLVFAKLRDSNTAFIQPVLDELDINKGIYIDIFPIDNFPMKNFEFFKTKFLEKIYQVRVLAQLNRKTSFFKKIIFSMSKIIIPDWKKAMCKLDNIYVNVKESNKCLLYGGKILDRGLDWEFFGNGDTMEFEGMKVSVPKKYGDYLNVIYGDYKTYSPSNEYMRGDDIVEISASVIDTKKSYRDYIKD